MSFAAAASSKVDSRTQPPPRLPWATPAAWTVARAVVAPEAILLTIRARFLRASSRIFSGLDNAEGKRAARPVARSEFCCRCCA